MNSTQNRIMVVDKNLYFRVIRIQYNPIWKRKNTVHHCVTLGETSSFSTFVVIVLLKIEDCTRVLYRIKMTKTVLGRKMHLSSGWAHRQLLNDFPHIKQIPVHPMSRQHDYYGNISWVINMIKIKISVQGKYLCLLRITFPVTVSCIMYVRYKQNGSSSQYI